jgi:hypothetical protein
MLTSSVELWLEDEARREKKMFCNNILGDLSKKIDDLS